MLAETPQMDRLIPTQIFPAGREPTEALRTRKDYRSSGKLFSLVAFNERPAGKVYTLQLAQDRSMTSKLKGISLCYSSPFSSAALWPRL
jgi:hypothetical protein